MRLSKITFIVLVCIIVLSIFVAKISNLIAIKYHEMGAASADGLIQAATGQKIHVEDDLSLTFGDSTDHLMWFVQVGKR
jgi:hypothetical protein